VKNGVTCDVLIAGGGPAGSACAWKLRQSGLDVVILDKARFPRDKVCAGWITPQVVEELQIDAADYARTRTFQTITGFRIGFIGGASPLTVTYDRPVSYGIRRCEFDHYLLERSGAHIVTGEPVTRIRRDAGAWVVNERYRARVLVGAGGHFCSVARMLNGNTRVDRSLVAAQEAEFPAGGDAGMIAGSTPELYFCRDLSGYGWCFRKGSYLNIGFGRLNTRGLPRATTEFLAFLRETGRIEPDAAWPWRGHAYLISRSPRRRLVDEGVVLVGDAAGLAYAQSGEGIRPAIESGLLAAATLVNAGARYDLRALVPYAEAIEARFGSDRMAEAIGDAIPAGVSRALARRLLTIPWFVRRVVVERWFLHAHDTAFALN
jgi:geranylgeranyl reductase family protein